jgi:DNA (cytosine-5)-methyltransferase 1
VNSITTVDLFAGAGGTSTGLVAAAKSVSSRVNLTAINHNRKALETHKVNFPWATHILTELQYVDPAEVVPEGRLDGLVASPECTFFSRARGGKPIRPQDRASPWYLGRWIHKLDVPWVLIENVPEITRWGPLDSLGRPEAAGSGQYFKLWIHMFRKAGYSFDYRILNAADYGDATSRKRFFAIARKDGTPITWPVPTHSRKPAGSMRKWRSAREIIDFSVHGESIFTRKRPLSANTMKRIIAGLRKFSSSELRPFIVLLEHSLLSPENRIRDIDLPLPAITGAHGGAFAIAEPFLLPVEGIYRGNTAKPVDDPLGTITQRGYGGFVEPYIVENKGYADAINIESPVPTITGKPGLYLVEPYLIEYYGNGNARTIEEPIPTIPTHDRFALIQPGFMIDGREYRLEILYRMLKPRELASAMGFPSQYQFIGTQQDQVKQIGNAVAVNMARSLISSLIMPGKEALK